MVCGVKQVDAARFTGMARVDLSRAYNSPAGQEYAAKVRALCEHYVAAMHALGVVPSDITRQTAARRTPNPPGTPSGIRNAIGQRLRERAGLPPTPPPPDDTTT